MVKKKSHEKDIADLLWCNSQADLESAPFEDRVHSVSFDLRDEYSVKIIGLLQWFSNCEARLPREVQDK